MGAKVPVHVAPPDEGVAVEETLLDVANVEAAELELAAGALPETH
jgi:hypothetical protein